jgi:hypothetical protein
MMARFQYSASGSANLRPYRSKPDMMLLRACVETQLASETLRKEFFVSHAVGSPKRLFGPKYRAMSSAGTEMAPNDTPAKYRL